MRKDVRTEKDRLDPGGRQRRAFRKSNIKLRRADQWRLTRVLITACRDQRNRADVVTAIRVTVDARM